MLHNERQKFIDNELKSLWSSFHWAVAVQQVWFNILSPYEYSDAKEAVRTIYTNGDLNFQRQLIPAFKAAMKKYNKEKAQPQPVLVYSLKSENGITKQFYQPKGELPPDYIIMELAEKMVKLYKGLYGGEWDIVRSWENNDADIF